MRMGPVVTTAVLAALAPLTAEAQSTQSGADFAPPITQPRWEKRPLPDYPEAAMSQKIVDGRAVVECTALATGELADCFVIEESPHGAGFGQAVVRATARARLSTVTPDYVPNARFRFVTNFAMR